MNYENFLHITDAYKYCPRCAQSLEKKGRNHLKCSSCNFNFFINNAPTCGLYPINDKNQIMIAKRAQEPYKGYWDNVGGFIDIEENFEMAAKREAKEELGVEIEVIELIDTYYNAYPYQGINMPMLNIDAMVRITSGEPKAADDISEFRWFTLYEALEQQFAYEFIRTTIQKIKEKIERNN